MKDELNEEMKTQIDDLVSEILTTFGYDVQSGGYVNIVGLVNFMGFTIGETNKLKPSEDGFISISKDKADVVIGVNEDRSFEEKRFISAHELGHYFLHYKDQSLSETVMHREHRKGKDAKENETDFFAACLLMPYETFKSKMHTLNQLGLPKQVVVKSLQHIFKVPEESIVRRIAEIEK